MEPAEHIVMPDTLGGRIRFEHRQMDALGEITPTVRQYRRVAAFWYNLVDARGIELPRGIEGTWKRIWELVSTIHGIENAPPSYMALLLTSPPRATNRERDQPTATCHSWLQLLELQLRE